MRRFADELRADGFEVDYRHSASQRAGHAAHVAECSPDEVIATEPASFDGLEMLRDLDVTVVRSNQFLCHYDDFATWAEGRRQLKMEDFYRWQRRRLGYLMEPDADGGDPQRAEPVTGRWNYDDENRERPPKTGNPWPEPQRSRSMISTATCSPTFPTPAGARNQTAPGPPHRRAALAACVTSSMTYSRCSAPTRMRWSNDRGTSPTRCCRRT